MNANFKLLAGAVLAALSPLASHAGCVNVGGTAGCFASIQAAIDSAAWNDTITIAAGTYYEGNIRMNAQVNLVGAGRDATIVDASVDNGDGTRSNGPTAIFYSNNFDPQVTSTISDLTVRGGYRGVYAGRFNTVTLQNVRLTGNGPGSGAGAFINSGVLIVRDSLVEGNRAVDGLSCDWYWEGGGGGGVAAGCGGGTVQVYGSTITGNYAFGLGGGLLLGGFDDVVENTTVSGNEATEYGKPANFGIGGALLSGLGKIRFSTFADNAGGGLAVSDAMPMIGSLVQNNSGPGGNCWAGPITSLGYNVSSDATCVFAGSSTDLASTDAMLQPLGNNGGSLPTHALVAHSPATDLVPASACDLATDERGVSRPQGANCDAGAYEWVDNVNPVVAAHANVNVPATRPSGADVTYAPATATDNLAVASVGCLPSSGSAFPVGNTTVTCTAIDVRGNVGTGTFTVHVQGVAEQIQNLLVLMGAANNGLTAKAAAMLGMIALGHPRLACPILSALEHEVKALSGKKIPVAKANAILVSIGQIRDALDC
jgi:hypothetical protein